MAKRGIIDQPKIIALADALKIDECFAAGIMECLWQWVAKHRHTGDITGVVPSIVCRGIRYSGDADSLFEHLVAVRLIDRLDDGRTVIHDWHDHADDTVHKNLANRRERFWNGSEPKRKPTHPPKVTVRERFHNGSAQPEPKPEPIKQVPNGTSSEPSEASVSPVPKPEKPLAPKPEDGVYQFPIVGRDSRFRSWWLTAPKIDEYRDSFPGVDLDRAFKTARQWCIDNPTKRKTAKGMPAFLTKWLNKNQNLSGMPQIANGRGPPHDPAAEQRAAAKKAASEANLAEARARYGGSKQ